MSIRKLPTELHSKIIEELPDSDVRTYALLCRETLAVVRDDEAPFWYPRAFKKYEMHIDRRNYWVASLYRHRERALKLHTRFETGKTCREKFVLSIIRGLIKDANLLGQWCDGCEFPNLELVRGYARRERLLDASIHQKMPEKRINPLLLAIQATLSHIRFGCSVSTRGYSYCKVRKWMYASPASISLFGGPNCGTVNTAWVVAASLFWKRCIYPGQVPTPDCDCIWQDATDCFCSDGPNDDMIGPWYCPLRSVCGPQEDRERGTEWSGIYENVNRRALRILRDPYAVPRLDGLYKDFGDDEFPAGDWMTMHYNPDSSRHPWKHPEALEDLLVAVKHPSVYSTAAENLLQFQAHGLTAEKSFRATGWFSKLPPQCGIPGWQRFTMLKIESYDFKQSKARPRESPCDEITHHFGEEERAHGPVKCEWEREPPWKDKRSGQRWIAYEGVVLPGSEIIFGRRWVLCAHRKGNLDLGLTNNGRAMGDVKLCEENESLTTDSDDESEDDDGHGTKEEAVSSWEDVNSGPFFFWRIGIGPEISPVQSEV